MEFGALLALIFRLSVPTVLTIEKVIGQAKTGTDKKTMAKTALAGATEAALSVLGGDNAQLAQEASDIAGVAIDQAVAITKISGQYQAATKQAAATAVAATQAAVASALPAAA